MSTQVYDATYLLPNNYTPAHGYATYDSNPRFCADVNGDGKDDIVAFGNDGVHVGFSNGTSL